MSRWQPKRWARPRSRRAREGVGLAFSAIEILKDIWHDGFRRPWWARLAYERGWMTAEAYYEIEPTEVAPNPFAVLYENSPFFALLKKEPLDV